MTLVTGTAEDIGLTPDNSLWMFSSPLRESSDGEGLITPKWARRYPVEGVISIELDPGPAIINYRGIEYQIEVPESGTAKLKDLIAAEIAFPTGTPPQLVGDAVDAYLNVNPLEWAQVGDKPTYLAAGNTQAAARSEIAAQAADADLTAIAGLTSAADKIPYYTGAGTAALADLTSAGRALAGAANTASQRSTLGVDTLVQLERHNPDADWAAAMTAAVAEANSTGGTVVLKRGKTYTINAGVTFNDIPVRIDFNGAKVVRSSTMLNGYALGIRFSNTTPQSVVGLTDTTYDWGGSSDTTPCTRVEVASTSGWAAGDRAVIVSDDPIPGADPSFGQREGERVRIAAVVGNYLYLAKPLLVTLTTNVRIAKLTVGDVDLTAPWIEDAPSSPATRNICAIEIRQAVEPRISRSRMRNLLTD